MSKFEDAEYALNGGPYQSGMKKERCIEINPVDFVYGISQRIQEQKPKPSHKFTLSKGTVIKGIDSNYPDIVVSNDVDIEFNVSIELYMDNSKNHVDCYLIDKYIPVYMDGVL